MPKVQRGVSGATLAGILAAALPARAQPAMPDSIAMPGGRVVLTLQAAGAQIYECVADAAAGRPGWRFREPVATLVENGRTVGRHFAGPSWQLGDGSLITAKAVASAPGATGNDIPWLKLEAVPGQASGRFAAVAAIQRIRTSGGVLAGACDAVGALRPVPYTGDYVFLAKAD